jgi:Flp pilus assembly protein TadB
MSGNVETAAANSGKGPGHQTRQQRKRCERVKKRMTIESSQSKTIPLAGLNCHAITGCGKCAIIKEDPMLWTIAVILIVLWLLGLVSSYTLGGFIHILLVIAIVVVVIGFIQGRRSG